MLDLEACKEAYYRQSDFDSQKIWEDYKRYEKIIQDCNINTVIETGTYSGGSARWFASNESVDKVISIDINGFTDSTEKVTYVKGSSIDPVVVSSVRSMISEQDIVLVSLDSDHSPLHVYGELKAYWDLVPLNCYLVVEDGLVRFMPIEDRCGYGDGPLGGLDLFMEENNKFQLDESIQDMYPATNHVDGWLKRIEL